MTTKTTQSESISNVSAELVGTKFAGARYVNVNKRKHYFVSDLTASFGTSFLNKLAEPLISRRIVCNGNSQQRRLVPAASVKWLAEPVKKTTTARCKTSCDKKSTSRRKCAKPCSAKN